MPQHNTQRGRFAHGWLRGEDFWGDPVSENFVKLDMLLHSFVEMMTLTQPPEAFTPGDMFVVARGGAGSWAGHSDHLAIAGEDGWHFFEPYRGVTVRSANPAGRFWWNGETWLPEAANSPEEPIAGTRYDVSISVGYEAEPRETLLALPIPQAMTLPSGGVGSKARATVAPVGEVRLSIRRNDVEVGTITFSSGNTIGTFAIPGPAIFAENQMLSVVMPDNPAAGFENYGVVLRMALSPT